MLNRIDCQWRWNIKSVVCVFFGGGGNIIQGIIVLSSVFVDVHVDVPCFVKLSRQPEKRCNDAGYGEVFFFFKWTFGLWSNHKFSGLVAWLAIEWKRLMLGFSQTCKEQDVEESTKRTLSCWGVFLIWLLRQNFQKLFYILCQFASFGPKQPQVTQKGAVWFNS